MENIGILELEFWVSKKQQMPYLLPKTKLAPPTEHRPTFAFIHNEVTAEVNAHEIRHTNRLVNFLIIG